MKKNFKRVFSIVLCLCMIITGTTFAFAETPTDNPADTEIKQLVELLGQEFDKEEMFDYLSYVYLGWRTTGGRWQNQVIGDFIHSTLVEAGYTKSDTDKSTETSGEYAWVSYYDSNTTVWDPEYAKLDITTDADIEGKEDLINRINVESYAFNPTTETYQNHYNKTIDGMYQWITEKDESGNRINVENGEEAKLNDRCHLAWQTCFTDPMGTTPTDAKGVEGQVVYVGTVSGNGKSCSKFGDDLSQLKGKVLLSDSSLSSTFKLAANADAVAVMSTASLSSYSVPKNSDGSIVAPFETSARYARGAGTATTSARTATGKPIVEWQFSNDQKTALKELLEKAGDEPVMAKSISIGGTYAMNAESVPLVGGGSFEPKGQAVAMAEVKGTTYPDERIIICAHVQEPGSNDNATGVGNLLGMATAYKRMIDAGKIERPNRTITFLWGDEMQLATLWMENHPTEKLKVVSVLDMDMTGEDPDKTGGVMRIEKTPDPSAEYNYTLDTLYWQDAPGYDENFADSDGNFVRLPDSHTLWGAGSTAGMFSDGFFLNDLYMAAAQNVIAHYDSGFRVDVCPYEGGSDHSRFLAQNIPALLTWHFTDYTYHTSVDTLAMSSAREMKNVGITTMVTALMIANSTDSNQDIALELLKEVYDAAIARFDIEQKNTDNHKVYTIANGGDYKAALNNEKEVLNAWGDWYDEALASVAEYLLDSPSEEYMSQETAYRAKLKAKLDESLEYAEEVLKAPYIPLISDVTNQSPNTENGEGAQTTPNDTASDNSETINSIKNTKLIAKSIKSKAKGKSAIKVYWYDENGQELNFDGYEIYRSTKQFSGFGKKPFFKTNNTKYYNTAIQAGTKYYYKVRAYKLVDGEKIYTKYSSKAIRTA